MFHNDLHVFTFIPALLHLLHLLSLLKSLVQPPFIYTLYDECSEEVKREYSSAIYTLRDYKTYRTEKVYFLKIIWGLQ